MMWVGSGLLVSQAGRVVAFHLRRDIVGLDAVADGVHPCDIRVLEDGVLRLARFALIEQLSNAEPRASICTSRSGWNSTQWCMISGYSAAIAFLSIFSSVGPITALASRGLSSSR